MDVSSIIAKSRRQTGTSVGQKSDALMLADLNIVHKDIFSRLATKDKKYTWQRYTADTVTGQSEYLIPKQVLSETGIKRVLNVSIKYASDLEYIPCGIYDSSKPIDDNYTDTNKPYFINRDDSIFVYPAPTSDVVGGVMVEGQYIPLDLELTTTEGDIKLAKEYHDIMVKGLNVWNFGDKQLFDKEGLARQQYEARILEMVQEGGADIEGGYEEDQADVILQGANFLP